MPHEPNCNCRADLDAELATRNSRLVFNLFGPFRAVIQTYKIDSKKRGGPTVAIASYCPFCGTKYPTYDGDFLKSTVEKQPLETETALS